jgi:Ca2+/Na+ antiporter
VHYICYNLKQIGPHICCVIAMIFSRSFVDKRKWKQNLLSESGSDRTDLSILWSEIGSTDLGLDRRTLYIIHTSRLRNKTQSRFSRRKSRYLVLFSLFTIAEILKMVIESANEISSSLHDSEFIPISLLIFATTYTFYAKWESITGK